ncbi:MAG: hypothetical protein V4649_02425 [Bacteroidota bacterium]
MKRLLILAAAALIFAGCYNDKYDKLYPTTTGSADPCDTANATVSYAATISGIMSAKCATTGCHDAGTNGGGYTLSTYTGVRNAAIVTNRLLGAIQHVTGYSQMPQGQAKLPACEIAQITKWVNQGAPNN